MCEARKSPWIAVLPVLLCVVTLAAAADDTAFAPLDHWREAVLAGDASALRALYSTNPPAFDLPSGGNLLGIDEEVASLIGWRTAGLNRMKLDIIKTVPLSPELKEIFFQAEIGVATNSGPQTYYFTAKQIWMRRRAASGKGASKAAPPWRIVSASRTEWTRLRKPDSLSANLYPQDANAEA